MVEEVLEHATQEGVAEYLPRLWDMIQRLIPSARHRR